jgi:hypothetical protein
MKRPLLNAERVRSLIENALENGWLFDYAIDIVDSWFDWRALDYDSFKGLWPRA